METQLLDPQGGWSNLVISKADENDEPVGVFCSGLAPK